MSREDKRAALIIALIFVSLAALALILSASVARGQPAVAPSACNARSTEGCFCLDSARVVTWREKALAFDEMVANPPSCSSVEAGGWSTVGVLLLEILKYGWGEISTRMLNDLEWEASWCRREPDGWLDPRYCLDGRTPLAERLRREPYSGTVARGSK